MSFGNTSGYDIDLSTVEVRSGAGNKPPLGYHVARVISGEDKLSKDGKSKMALVRFEGYGPGGKLFEFEDNFMIQHAEQAYAHNYKQAVEIGHQKIKSLLVYGRAANPNKFTGIQQFLGLTVGVLIAPSEPYVGNDGKQREGWPRIAEREKPFYYPQEIAELQQRNGQTVSVPALPPADATGAMMGAPPTAPAPMPQPRPTPAFAPVMPGMPSAAPTPGAWGGPGNSADVPF